MNLHPWRVWSRAWRPGWTADSRGEADGARPWPTLGATELGGIGYQAVLLWPGRGGVDALCPGPMPTWAMPAGTE